jgi:hypothetical protein
MASGRRELVVLAFPHEVDEPELAATIERLRAQGSLVVEDGVRLEWLGDGKVDILEVPGATEPGEATATLQWFLQEVASTGVRLSAPERRPAGLSESFVTELHDVFPAATTCVALVAPGVDVSGVLAELDHFPGARLVYAELQDRSTLPAT